MIGQYTFTRTIDDRYSHTTHTASGILGICADTWQENGILHTIQDNPFYQSYAVQFVKNSIYDGIIVSTQSGEFFRLDTIHGIHKIHHVCGCDTYNGIWTYDGYTLSLVWHVIGPSKDYTMHTTYTPVQ